MRTGQPLVSYSQVNTKNQLARSAMPILGIQLPITYKAPRKGGILGFAGDPCSCHPKHGDGGALPVGARIPACDTFRL